MSLVIRCSSFVRFVSHSISAIGQFISVLSFPHRWESHVVSLIIIHLPPCIYRSTILHSSTVVAQSYTCHVSHTSHIPHSLLYLPPNPNKVKDIFIGGNRSFIILLACWSLRATFVSQFLKVLNSF